MIAGDVHLQCHQDKKFGNFLLQLLVPSDFDGSGWKTCKNDENDDDDLPKELVFNRAMLKKYQELVVLELVTVAVVSNAILRVQWAFALFKGSCYCSCWYQVIDLEGVKS